MPFLDIIIFRRYRMLFPKILLRQRTIPLVIQDNLRIYRRHLSKIRLRFLIFLFLKVNLLLFFLFNQLTLLWDLFGERFFLLLESLGGLELEVVGVGDTWGLGGWWLLRELVWVLNGVKVLGLELYVVDTDLLNLWTFLKVFSLQRHSSRKRSVIRIINPINIPLRITILGHLYQYPSLLPNKP